MRAAASFVEAAGKLLGCFVALHKSEEAGHCSEREIQESCREQSRCYREAASFAPQVLGASPRDAVRPVRLRFDSFEVGPDFEGEHCSMDGPCQVIQASCLLRRLSNAMRAAMLSMNQTPLRPLKCFAKTMRAR